MDPQGGDDEIGSTAMLPLREFRSLRQMERICEISLKVEFLYSISLMADTDSYQLISIATIGRP
jgi:hypothetical protein